MKHSQASVLVNIALAGGIVLAIAVGVGFSLFYPGRVPTPPTAPSAAATPQPPERKAEIFLAVPPRAATPPPAAAEVAPMPAPPPQPPPVPPARAADAAPAPPAIVPSLSSPPAIVPSLASPPAPAVALTPPPAAAHAASADPFEPPPPPMTTAAVTSAPPAARGTIANGVSLRPPQSDSAITVRPGDPMPALRTVELETHDIHRVPDIDKPMPSVTIVNRQGKVLAVTHAPPPGADGSGPVPVPPPPSVTQANPPPRDIPPPRTVAMNVPKPRAGETMPNANLSGQAIVTAALELNVDGRPLRLYGLKPPEATDVCAPSTRYAPRACPDVSREVLGSLLGAQNRVSCRVLSAGRAANPAVCHDDKGTDLGSYLVAHGFALADTNEAVDYSGAEIQARSAGLGLWHYR